MNNEMDDKLLSEVNPTIMFGVISLVIFIGGFLLWSLLFPLDSASLAEGKIVVDSSRKTIQHLEGGIIKEIYVKDGDNVKQGQVLLSLDNTQIHSQVQALKNRQIELMAQKTRLMAEHNNAKKIIFPDELMNMSDNEVAAILKAQESLFYAREKSYAGTIEILHLRIEQLEKQIDSYQAQVASSKEQLSFIDKEINAFAALKNQSYVDKPRLYALQREQARLKGELGEKEGLIAKTEQQIGETKSRLLNLSSERSKEILESLNAVQTELHQVTQKLTSSMDVKSRTEIKAPVAGTVVGLQVHTVGGVVTPGSTLLEIVPDEDIMVIEVLINPNDIDAVHPGLKANIQLTAFNMRNMPSIEGVVEKVSADVFEDKSRMQSFYKAIIHINADALDNMADIKLYPGMPVQVAIITDQRTPFNYFISPITSSFGRAFKEQ